MTPYSKTRRDSGLLEQGVAPERETSGGLAVLGTANSPPGELNRSLLQGNRSRPIAEFRQVPEEEPLISANER